MATINEASNINVNDSFWIKRLFLSFLQAYFAEHSKYTWTTGQNTKIIIADKYAMDLSLAAKKPSIIVSRGYMRWAQSTIGQYYQRSLISSNSTFTDLVIGSMTFNCIAKNGLVCEELAMIIRNAFTGFKDQIKANGLHSIDNIAVEEERILKADADIDLTVVPVTLQYTKQTFLNAIEDFYSTNVKISFNNTNYGGYSGYVDSETTFPMQLFEYRDYVVWASGFVFNEGYAPPTGSILSLTYIDALTLGDIVEAPSGVINGINRSFRTTNKIYGDHPLLREVEDTVSGYI